MKKYAYIGCLGFLAVITTEFSIIGILLEVPEHYKISIEGRIPVERLCFGYRTYRFFYDRKDYRRMFNLYDNEIKVKTFTSWNLIQ